MTHQCSVRCFHSRTPKKGLTVIGASPVPYAQGGIQHPEGRPHSLWFPVVEVTLPDSLRCVSWVVRQGFLPGALCSGCTGCSWGSPGWSPRPVGEATGSRRPSTPRKKSPMRFGRLRDCSFMASASWPSVTMIPRVAFRTRTLGILLAVSVRRELSDELLREGNSGRSNETRG